MRINATAISASTGCMASTARGTSRSCSDITTAADTAPAAAQASARRRISPNPEKRHMPCGTRNSQNAHT